MYRYREREREDCSSESDDDNITKLHKRKNEDTGPSAIMDTDHKPEASALKNSKKRKVNNIWASVVQEQSINDDLCKVNMNNKLSDRLGWDRGSESYDFTRKSEDPRPDTEEDEELDLDYGVSDIENEFEASENNLLGKDKPEQKKKSSPKICFVERIEDAQKIAHDVARRLHEPKVELIERCIQVLGRKKVFDLLHMTEDIQGSGGMLIVDGTRKRTAGGVFLYQLRNDPRIQKKEKNYIFAEDKVKEINLRKSQRKLQRKNLARKNAKAKKMELDNSEPTSIENADQTTVSVSATEVKVETPEQKEVKNEVPSDVELEEGEIL